MKMGTFFSVNNFCSLFPPTCPRSPSAPEEFSPRKFDLAGKKFRQKKFISDKKGFLLAEETLKILIAVIALVFLVYFLTSIYFAKVNGDRVRQSESLLRESEQSFQVLMNNISEGESKTREVIEPSGWYIFGFSGDVLPNSCAGENCVCLCKNVLWEGFDDDRQQKQCSDKGRCLADSRIGDFPEIKITGGLKTIEITNRGGKIYFFERK